MKCKLLWPLLIAAPVVAGLDVGATKGCIVFRQHDRGHTNGLNWSAFLEFAEKVWSGRLRCSGKVQ